MILTHETAGFSLKKRVKLILNKLVAVFYVLSLLPWLWAEAILTQGKDFLYAES
jgi:hypothetical protein